VLERRRERAAERVPKILPVGAEILAEEKGQRGGIDRVDRFLVRQRLEDARRDRVQFSNPEILQGAIIISR
jgi:hypothetical protein